MSIYDDEFEYDRAMASKIMTKIDGPFGPTWIVLSQSSRMSDLELVLEHKTREFEEKRKNVQNMSKDRSLNANIYKMMEDPEFGPDAYKLYIWINEKESETFGLSKKEQEEWLKTEANVFVESTNRKKEVFERLLKEEQQGKRITVYDEGRFFTSLTKDSSHAEMQTVLAYVSNDLTEEQVLKINNWMSKAKIKSEEQLKDEPIRLRHLDGSGFHTLTKETHPDFLRAAVRDRNAELGAHKLEIIETWINDSQSRVPDHEDRIRIFHKGLDREDDTTQIDLSKHSIDFVEKLQHHLTTSDAALLPEHKSRLDRRYDELLAERQSPNWKEPESIQVPVGTKGKTIDVSRNLPEHVLDVVYDLYAWDNLTEENRERLWQWRCEAPYEGIDRNTVRAYEQQDKTKFRVLNKFKDIAEIEKLLKSRDYYFTHYESEKARDWVDSLEPLFPREPDKQTAILMHSTGLTLDITMESAQKDPTRVSEVLSDSHWTTTERNRRLIESWLHRADRNPEEEIAVSGLIYNRNQPVAELKKLADSMVENNFEALTPEAAKKLLTWIHTKEKFGDDYYSDKPPPDPQPVPPSRYDKLFGDRLKLDVAVSEILTDIGKVATKEKKKDKDEPFPSF